VTQYDSPNVGKKCMLHSRCAQVWKNLFPLHVGQAMLNPSIGLPYSSIPFHISSDSKIIKAYHDAGMNPACLDKEILQLQSKEWPDQAFLRKLVERVPNLYGIDIPNND